MEMNTALTEVESFLETYRNDHDDWNPTEIRVLPSGDEQYAIKIWINFGPDGDESAADALAERAIAALRQAHPEVIAEFTLKVSADAD
ncbi:MAG TPA: hypothetical protein VML75_11415 [Kofleriaceae bacterium]|nr:hypothetical protein [Kofleriaceae bacterium]